MALLLPGAVPAVYAEETPAVQEAAVSLTASAPAENTPAPAEQSASAPAENTPAPTEQGTGASAENTSAENTPEEPTSAPE